MIEKKIFNLLKNKQQTLALAESCTGGGLSYSITKIPGISQIYKGCLVCYTNDIKTSLLNISKKDIEISSAEGEDIAIKMAKNVKELFKSHWSLSITGLSGPLSNEKNLPVGTVFIVVCGPNFTRVFKHEFKNLSRAQHRRVCIKQALSHLLYALKSAI